MRHAVLRTLLCVLLLAASLTAAAAQRVALVVGNGAYQHTVPLANPVNDALALADSLGRLGFEVVVATDSSQVALEASIREFAKAARGAEFAVFFYAGHGLQVNGVNYLIPVDAVLESEDDLVFAAVDLNDVLGIMTRSAQASLVFLDACRDNPMADLLARGLGTRSTDVGRGLAQVSVAVGALIAYATQPGNVALDGQGEHSPFTAALLQHIETPGLELRQVLTRVRDDVVDATDGKQVPWDHSSLRGDVFLVPASAAPAPAPAPAPIATGAEIWQVIQHSDNPKDFEFFLQSFPGSPFAPYAKLRLDALAQTGPTAEELAAEQAATAAAAAEAHELKRALAEMEAKLVAEAEARAAAEAAAAQGGTAWQASAAAGETAAETIPPLGEAELKLASLRAAEAGLELGTEARQKVQRALTLLGHDTRGVDGAFGKNTRTAVAAFQSRQSLEVTGYLDELTLKRLLNEAEDELAAWDVLAAKRLGQKAETAQEELAAETASQPVTAASVPTTGEQQAMSQPTQREPWAGRWQGSTTISTTVGIGEIVLSIVDGVVDCRFTGDKAVRLTGMLDDRGQYDGSISWIIHGGRSTFSMSGTFPYFEFALQGDRIAPSESRLTVREP